MKNLRTLEVCLTFFLLLSCSISNSQSQFGFDCGFVDSTGLGNYLSFSNFNGLTKPSRTDLSGDTLSSSDAVFPVIIVFVQFKDDFTDWQWPTNQAPIYLDSMIAETKSYNSDWWDAYDEDKEPISDYWLELSRGKFHVTGRAFSVVLDKTQDQYSSDVEINLEIWRKIDSEIPDWTEYDKWRDTVENGQIKFYNEDDGYVDMIYKVHKNYSGPLEDERGYASLTFIQPSVDSVVVDTLNNVKVGYGFRGKGSGVTVSFTARKFHNMLALQHEHGHCLYAGGHITYGKVSYGPGGDGFFSPYETVLLKYRSMDTVSFSTQTNYYVADYSARGASDNVILRVPVSGNECFLISNRGNASTWDTPMLGDTTQIIGPYKYEGNYSRGVYIYHVNNFGIIYPQANSNPQDEECADGVWYWSNRGQSHRYAWDAGYCYDAGSWTYYLRDSVSYNNDSGWSYISADGRSHDPVIWAGIGKINESNECLMGTDRLFTNSTDIYSNEEVLGDRYDAWRPGYNEIFSPYSSPNTKNASNSSTGIFIWLYSSSGSGPSNSAAFKIFKTVQGGLSEDSILHLTPPSRPMGLTVIPCDSQPTLEGYRRIKLRWNHNMEPDMRRSIGGEGLAKRYRIYRSTASDMGSVPPDALAYSQNYYDCIDTVDINENSSAEYIDEELISICNKETCAPPNYCIEYPVRYRVQAVDKYDDVSVLSDFVNTRAGFVEIGYGDMNGLTNTESTLPKTYSLSQNYPNPFNPVTNIRYDLPQDNFVTIRVYDILGKEVVILVNENKEAGRYLVSFNASNFSSGIYFYTIKAGMYEYTRRMTLLK